ncbi:cytochrome P450 [Schizopora paradoxa]|uniref:Cytochrome P450 n=1 Tax=Schizopora paradoxa TaxID=27342 RepID=A0A0H2RPL4_9AGAM|nr:cytochrome P450 [Schizopora paradoxa]
MLTLNALDAGAAIVGVWLILKLSQSFRRSVKLSDIPGPPSASWIHGATKEIFANGSAVTFEKWEKLYGPVFRVPISLNSSEVVIFDTKALSHIISKDTFEYVNPAFMKKNSLNLFGKGLMWSDGENHRRQRKVLNPLFNVSSIRSMVPTFFDSAHKIKSAWESIIQQSSTDEAVIDISKWMNGYSLDSVGLAIFGHDFATLDGKESDIAKLNDSLGTTRLTRFESVVSRLSSALPILRGVPNPRSRIISSIHDCLSEIANDLVEGSSKGDTSYDRTIISTLLKAKEGNTMSEEEVISQIRILLQAGYETTAIGLTFVLIDLAKNPDAQNSLRNEILSLPTSEPTFDQILNSDALPYLSAVIQESLRIHPPVGQIVREAAQDDALPLNSPIVGKSGEKIERLMIPKGTMINIPLRSVNLSNAFWGPNAKEFVPERWLDNEKGVPQRAKEIQGYHHTLTFMDGPRMCLGRNIAVAEMKTAVAILVRNFTFEMRDGPNTKMQNVINLFARPKVVGEEGYAMPLRIRRFEA